MRRKQAMIAKMIFFILEEIINMKVYKKVWKIKNKLLITKMIIKNNNLKSMINIKMIGLMIMIIKIFKKIEKTVHKWMTMKVKDQDQVILIIKTLPHKTTTMKNKIVI
jgi:hypothetical protein